MGRARICQIVVAVGSVVFVVAAIVLLRGSQLVVGVLFVAALAIGAAPFVVDALVSAAPCRRPRGREPQGPGASVTTIVRVGGEPLDLAETCIMLAARSGPTVVVTATRADLAERIAPLDVPVHVGSSVEEALHDAAGTITTEAVLVIAVGCVPLLPACEAAAARLNDRTAWAIGTVRMFDDDSYAPESREIVGARLRANARRAGLDLWERDATLVNTGILRRYRIAPARPLGAWLRSLRADGYRGIDDGSTFALRVAPAGARVFWPATTAHQGALAADLADATTCGSFRARVLALGLLLRELYAYAFLLWMLAPLIIGASGEFPFRASPVLFVTVLAALGAARWLTLRLSHGIRLRPVNDLLAAAYEAPGSLRALLSACTRRIGATRAPPPQRSLMWAALVLMVASAIPLFDRYRIERGDTDIQAAAGLAILNLVLVWMFLLRSFAQRHWNRSIPRAPVRLPAVVDGYTGTTVDTTPSGVGVALDSGSLGVGSPASVCVTFPDGTEFATTGVVADRRVVAGREIVGLSLHIAPDRRLQWVGQTFDQLHLDEPGATVPRRRREATARYGPDARATRQLATFDRLVVAFVAALSALVIGGLALVVLGYRPLVIRSDSMVPTLKTGDLIVNEEVPASDIQVGDIVTVEESRDGDTITHRVRHVTKTDGRTRFETRGDANSTSEFWSRPSDAVLGRYRWRIPKVGGLVRWLHTADVRWSILTLAVGLVALGLTRAALAKRAAAADH